MQVECKAASFDLNHPAVAEAEQKLATDLPSFSTPLLEADGDQVAGPHSAVKVERQILCIDSQSCLQKDPLAVDLSNQETLHSPSAEVSIKPVDTKELEGVAANAAPFRPSTEGIVLSKNQQKKILKRQRNEELKIIRKAEEKSKRHLETERKKREWGELLSGLSTEERAAALQQKVAVRVERRQDSAIRRERLKKALEDGQNIVVDLDWGDLMRPEELRSLRQQIMYSYAANGKADVPARLSLTGCQGLVATEMENIMGFDRWQIHTHAAPYTEVFSERKADLVYLTADSPNVVDTLLPDKIYIVGGLVDRNRFKHCTLDKAAHDGIATARLPIGEHLRLLTSKVLTVNQVVEILLGYLATHDWQTAFDLTVPQRKRLAEESHDRSPDSTTGNAPESSPVSKPRSEPLVDDSLREG